MATIHDVARSLGLSVRAVRLRIDALDGMLDAHLRRGENNQIIFDGDALAILRHFEDLRRGEGISIRQAALRVRQEIAENSAKPERQAQSPLTSNPEALVRENTLLREMLEEVRRDRDSWKTLAMSLQEHLALPSPKPRRRWLAWLRRSMAR